jgi:phage shock protein PspC (stress-responsive transcriptional regulator)
MEPKKLFRSSNNKIIAGICTGLAEYFNVDTNIVRVLFVFVTFFWGASILLYLILWIIIPINESVNSNEVTTIKTKNNFLLLLGIIIFAFGAFSLIAGVIFGHLLFFPFRIVPFFETLFALTFIAFGLYLIFDYANKKNHNENSNQRVLSKSLINKKFLGVCAGIAEYFKIDPTVVRVVWVIFSLISFGIAVIVYIVLGIILPNEQIIKRSV